MIKLRFPLGCGNDSASEESRVFVRGFAQMRDRVF